MFSLAVRNPIKVFSQFLVNIVLQYLFHCEKRCFLIFSSKCKILSHELQDGETLTVY